MKRAAFALLVVLGTLGLGASSALAQPRPLGKEELDAMVGEQPPEVVLLTFGVGKRIFEKFGHAALCLDYRDHREPLCFNYGVTNFADGPGMVWGFLRGEQKFWVDPEKWSDMVGFYEDEDRDIYEQVLPLTPEQARAVEHELLTSLEEAHRYYQYDHFYNNCTTRLRDIIDHATSGKLSAGSEAAYPLTFREIGYRGLSGLPPLVSLADFVVGRSVDETPSIWEAMFHPQVLRQRVQVAFGVEPRLLYKRQGPKFPVTGSTFRFQMLLLALVFAVPLLIATWRRRFQRAALIWATLYLTFWGIVIWGLVIVSSIKGIRWNENVLVLMPLDIALPILSPERRRRYAQLRVAGLFLVSALCGVGVLHQPLWIPVLSALAPLSVIAFDQKIAPPRA